MGPVAAVTATGLAVTTGVLAGEAAAPEVAASAQDQTSAISPVAQAQERAASPGALAGRERQVSRSQGRTSLSGAARRLRLSQTSGGQATRSKDLTGGDPRAIARSMLPEFGFSSAEFGCLDALYGSESGWDPHADNPSSSAYGIPQALTGGTHDNLPADYMTNPAAQIRWGLDYIRVSYGTPCSAWSFKQGNGWY